MKNFDAEEYVRCTFVDEVDRRAAYRIAVELRASGMYHPAERLLSDIIDAIEDCGEQVTFEYMHHLSRGTAFGILPNIDLAITDRCNLGCASCSHYGPLCADAELIPVDRLNASVKLLAEKALGVISGIYLLGGEPFLHPGLGTIMKESRSLIGNKRITVVSNMTLYDKNRSWFVPNAVENDIVLGYSAYPGVNDEQIQRAIEDSKEHGMRIIRFGGSPASFGLMLMNEERPYMGSGKIFCSMSRCLSLRDNFLYMCPKPTYVGYLNKAMGVNFEVSKFDRICLDDVEIPEEILVLMNMPNPFCRYCNVRGTADVPWRRSERQASEWIES